MALNKALTDRKTTFTKSLDAMNNNIREFELFFKNLPPVTLGDVSWDGKELTHLGIAIRGSSIAKRKAALGLLTALASKAMTQGETDLP